MLYAITVTYMRYIDTIIVFALCFIHGIRKIFLMLALGCGCETAARMFYLALSSKGVNAFLN